MFNKSAFIWCLLERFYFHTMHIFTSLHNFSICLQTMRITYHLKIWTTIKSYLPSLHSHFAKQSMTESWWFGKVIIQMSFKEARCVGSLPRRGIGGKKEKRWPLLPIYCIKNLPRALSMQITLLVLYCFT